MKATFRIVCLLSFLVATVWLAGCGQQPTPLPQTFKKAGKGTSCFECATTYQKALVADGYEASLLTVAQRNPEGSLHAVVVVTYYYDPTFQRVGRSVEELGWVDVR